MRPLLLAITVLMVLAAPATAEEKPPVPQGLPPQYCLASAVEEKGQVKVHVSILKTETRARMEGGQQIVYQTLAWMDGTPLVLGQTVRAFRPDGKQVGQPAVLKALSKPTATLYFVRQGTTHGVPDAFYLETLKPGSVALVFDMKDFTPPGSPER